LAFAARQVGIARYLVEQGADVDYISARGWTAANNLYRTGVPKAQATTQEFLEILGSSSFSEIDFQDAAGWSFMHLVAAYGNADDVKTAIRFGASTTLPIKTSLWIPIFCAVQFKNQETFRELAKYTGSAVATMADLRGWTLLHVAASTGNAEIIKMLLELGADVDVKTKAANLYVPEAMRGRCCTPEEIAQICGPEAHTTFVQTVRDFLL
jgi:ankyrin repeat protein